MKYIVMWSWIVSGIKRYLAKRITISKVESAIFRRDLSYLTYAFSNCSDYLKIQVVLGIGEILDQKSFKFLYSNMLKSDDRIQAAIIVAIMKLSEWNAIEIDENESNNINDVLNSLDYSKIPMTNRSSTLPSAVPLRYRFNDHVTKLDGIRKSIEQHYDF